MGARADFLVLPGADFEAVEAGRSPGADVEGLAARLATLRPLLTVLDGEVVWCAPDFDPESGPRPD